MTPKAKALPHEGVANAEATAAVVEQVREHRGDYVAAVEALAAQANRANRIMPGDLVERIGSDLDPRFVAATGIDAVDGEWLSLQIGSVMSDALPVSLYRIVQTKEQADSLLAAMIAVSE